MPPRKFCCLVCNKEIQVAGFTKHFAMHDNGTEKDKSKYPNGYICKCEKCFDSVSSLRAHYRWCMVHRNGKPANTLKGVSKNNGWLGKTFEELHGENHVAVRRKISEANIGRKFSSKTKEMLSLKRIEIIENGLNHVKWFSVQGIKVQGTFEKRFAEKLVADGVIFERHRIRYGGHRHYTPDFYIPDLKMYVEIKGWMMDNDIIKYHNVLIDNDIDLRIIVGHNELSNFENSIISINELRKFKNAY